MEAAEDQGKVPGAFMNLVRGKRIDGLIIANMREVERPFVEQLARDGFPVVVPGNAADSFHSRGGSFTDAATGRLLTQHLLDLGHRRIAHLAFAQEEFVSVAERRRGYQQALEGAGLSADPALVGYADISAQSGYVAMQKLLASKVPFTALFAGNDTIALGAMCALREAGKRIPKDVAVVGYDDIPLAAFANPSLTTLQIDPIVRGHESADMLHALMTGTHYKRLSSQYPGKLVVRESCGALAAGKLTSAMAEAKSVTPAKSARKAPAKAVRKRAAA